MRSRTARTLSSFPLNDRGDIITRLIVACVVVFSILLFIGYRANEKKRQEQICLRHCQTGDIEIQATPRGQMCYCRQLDGQLAPVKVIF